MCGIIGFTGKGDASVIVPSALKDLEYRGYDSAGLAVLSSGKINSIKGIGVIEKLMHSRRVFSGNTGIGHTRWATHGGVSQLNAHPHISNDGTIAVVHNGIIENFAELRKTLSRYKFSSETDSEVIVHLISNEVRKGHSFEKAVQNSCKKLKGSFAFIVLSSREPGKLIGVKKDSPLVLGVSGKGMFLSSDQTPLLKYTKRFVFLDDFEMVSVSGDSFKINNFKTGKKVKKEPFRVSAAYTSSGKLKYDHFMVKEIFEQPTALQYTLMQEKKKFNRISKLINGNELFFVANGSSFHAAMVGKELMSRIAHKRTSVVNASEMPYMIKAIPKNSVIVAISQSGETADVLESVKLAKKHHFKVVSIVNVFGSSLSRLSNESIYLNCGSEIGVASTKSFSSQLFLLYLLAFSTIGKFDSTRKKLLALIKSVKKTLLLNNKKAIALSKTLSSARDVYVLGRGMNYPIALEGALKIKEISYIHAEGMPAGEMKHGSLALIEKRTPVIVIAPDDLTLKDTVNNAHEIKSRGAFLIGVSDKKNKLFDFSFSLPKVEKLFYPLISVIPLQLLSYYCAVATDKNPDRPRNLAKCVTVK